MRLPVSLLAWLALSGCATSEAAAIKTRPADAAELKAIKEIKGDILASACFADTDGEHCVVAWGKNNQAAGDATVRSELFAAKFTRSGAGFAKKWSIKDFSEAPLTWVDMASDTIRVTDADGNGKAETGLFYSTLTDGMDPHGIKYMFHAEDKKYAIRGRIPLHMDDLDQYEKKLDPAFKGLAASLKKEAEGQWEAFVGPTLRQLEAEAKDDAE